MDKGTFLGTEPLGTKNSLSLALSAQTRRQEMLSGQEGGKEETPSPINCVTFEYLFFCQDAGEQSCDFCSGGGETIILGALAEEAIPQLEFHLTIQVTNIQ